MQIQSIIQILNKRKKRKRKVSIFPLRKNKNKIENMRKERGEKKLGFVEGRKDKKQKKNKREQN